MKNNVPPISHKQLDNIIGDLKQNLIYLSKSDKIGQDNEFFNDNFENRNELLDIDSWFDEDAESSMKFVSCIIALLTSDFLVL